MNRIHVTACSVILVLMSSNCDLDWTDPDLDAQDDDSGTETETDSGAETEIPEAFEDDGTGDAEIDSGEEADGTEAGDDAAGEAETDGEAESEAVDDGSAGWTDEACLAECDARCLEYGDPYFDWISAPLRGTDGFCSVSCSAEYPSGCCTRVEPSGDCYCVCVDETNPASAVSYVRISPGGDVF